MSDINVILKQEEIRVVIKQQSINVVLTGNLVTFSSHNQLQGLDADDHLQYLTENRGDVRYYLKSEIVALLSGKENANPNIQLHILSQSNPHNVTKTQIGLSNVTNDEQVKKAEKGVAGGVATLNSSGKVPAEQIESGGAVSSVNGKTGVVIIKTKDIDEDTNLYFTQQRVNENTILIDVDSKKHTHSNKTEIDKVTVGDHDIKTNNPHNTTLAQVGGTTNHTELSNIGDRTHAEIDAELDILADTSGINTGDQDLSPYLLILSAIENFEPKKSNNAYYVTSEEKTTLQNTTGVNTGDQDLSNLATHEEVTNELTSKSDIGHRHETLFVTVNDDTTLNIDNEIVFVNTTAKPIQITLPEFHSAGKIVVIKKISDGDNLVTIKPYATELLDGYNELYIRYKETSVYLKSDGNNWFII